MCGIAGVVGEYADRTASVRRMMDSLSHRGPDDHGLYEASGATLGHRRLSIIDLGGGHQPIVDSSLGLSIVFNGEIYNYKQLRKELLDERVQLNTDSDTEVILRLYHLRGKQVLKSLRGMFAFAIWDEKNQELFAARDHLGQKPFYYHVGSKGFAFASEIKALLAFDPSLRELDHEALDQYFSLRIIASPHSMFRRIRKLPPGHYLTYSHDMGLNVERYWTLDFEPKDTRPENDILDGLEEQLIEAMRLHVVSDVPVGAFVSGGLDSTLVAAIVMKHVAKEPIPTFTLGLPHKNFNEAPLARLVAERYGTDHHERVEVPSLTKYLPTLIHHLDEPSDPLSICTYMVAEMASEHVKVVLGGDGGDELFGGYDRYYGHRYAGYYAKLPKWIRSQVVGPVLGWLPEGTWYKSKAHQLKWLHRLSFSADGARYAKSLSYFYYEGQEKNSLYGPALKEALGAYDAESVIADAYHAAHAKHPVDCMLSADSQIRMPDHPVMISDRMTMAHGLEARSPFMDHVVAEYMAHVPAHFKVRGRSLRYLQRRLAKRYLPDELLRFPKQGFSSPLPYLLGDEYRRLFSIFLRDPILVRAGLVNAAPVNRLLDAHLAAKADHGNRLWLLLNAEIWYRMRIENQSRDTIAEIIRTERSTT
jgi:asparagine synthase (glutamine-hydrolysing)